MGFATVADRNAIHNEMPWEERDVPVTMYQFLSEAKANHGDRPAVSFQLQSGPKDPAETCPWISHPELLTPAILTACGC